LIHGSNKSENQKEKTNSTLNSQPRPRHSTPKVGFFFLIFTFIRTVARTGFSHRESTWFPGPPFQF